jgi:uncharacterized protein YcaQ
MLIDKKTARRYLLLKQLLLPPRTLTGYKGITQVFSTIHAVQFDPQNPCGTNVDLVLQARVSSYHPSDYYAWLYKDRKGIECFDKELCIVPIKDFTLCRKAADNTSRQRRLKNFTLQNRARVNHLLKIIRRNGEICSSQITDDRKVKSFWGNPTWGKAALDVLWKTGRLVISRRFGGRKYFALPQKLYGPGYRWSKANKIRPEHVIRRIRSVGFLPKTGTGQGWLGIGKGQQIVPVVNKLLKNNILTELQIEQTRRKYVMASVDIKTMKAAKSVRVAPHMTFLAPLDNLLWDRNLVKDVFNFEYKWEVYTPRHQRKYGHYTLPILYRDEFIGRIEPRKIGKILEIRGLWLEPGFQWSDLVNKSFSACLNFFKDYLDIQRIKWLCTRPR